MRINHQKGGVCFELFLPIATPKTSENSDETPMDFADIKTTTRALIVEDEMVIRRVIEKGFKNAGFEVLSVSDGEQALAVIQQSEVEIDILLSDVVLKGNFRKGSLQAFFVPCFPDAMVVLMRRTWRIGFGSAVSERTASQVPAQAVQHERPLCQALRRSKLGVSIGGQLHFRVGTSFVSAPPRL